jgi:hypothetical protein
VAPIALFPDTLLAQVLAASTYPLEIVEASRWVGANAGLKGDDLAAALENQDWDPSVESLVYFPRVLNQMSDNLDWTKDLGDAFLGQQNDVLDAVQRLRVLAEESGTLKTTEQQTVTVEQEVVTIVPAEPETVYVPAYNPSTAYGSGWTPPPQQYYGPMYQDPWGSVLTHGLAFGAGVAVGGLIWGVDWDDDDDDVHVYNNGGGGGGKKNVNVNKNINIGEINVGNRQDWRHRPEHRHGVNYRNEEVATRLREREATAAGPGQVARADRGDRAAQARAGLSERQGQPSAADRPRASQDVARGFGPGGAGGRRPQPASATRPQVGQQAMRDRQPGRPQPATQRPHGSGQRPSTAFGGGGHSGAYERAASARGAASCDAQRGGGGAGGRRGGRGGRGR